MDILVVGSGAREHVICNKLLESKQVRDVYCLPGNYGMKKDGIKLVDINQFEFDEIIKFVEDKQITFTVVGPEDVLVRGIVDEFKKHNLLIFGPTKIAAQLEGSKEFAKKIMYNAKIPTATYKIFTNIKDINEYLNNVEFPIVIKKNGLAAGKGVAIAENIVEAKMVCHNFLDSENTEIIIEKFLEGKEFSAMYFVQGMNIYPMPFSQDYKRAFDKDKGPNTGGMGAFAPLAHMDSKDRNEADKIINSVLLEMNRQNIEFMGILYAGLIKTKSGIKVIEFNVRFGDPETEVVLPLLKTDLAVNLYEMLHKNKTHLIWDDQHVNIGVVFATSGYPGKPKTIKLNDSEQLQDLNVFYSSLNENMCASGRAFVIVNSEINIKKARETIYKKIPMFTNFFCRKDIGK